MVKNRFYSHLKKIYGIEGSFGEESLTESNSWEGEESEMNQKNLSSYEKQNGKCSASLNNDKKETELEDKLKKKNSSLLLKIDKKLVQDDEVTKQEIKTKD